MDLIVAGQGDDRREANKVHAPIMQSKVNRHIFVDDCRVIIVLDQRWEVIKFTESDLKTLLDEMAKQKEK